MTEIKDVIMLAVALMVVGVIFPIALGLIGGAGGVIVTTTGGAGLNESLTLIEIVDPSIVTLLTVLLPIIAVIAVILIFLNKVRSN